MEPGHVGADRHARGDERVVVGRVDEPDAGDDHEQHHEELDPDQHHVDPHRLLDADGDQGGEDGDQQHGQQVDAAARSQILGPGNADVAEEDHRVRAPALRDHAGAEHQLQQQVPADDPGDDLAQAGVGERVRRARHRDRGRELRVAERRQPAGDGRDHEAQHDRGTGQGAGRSSGQGEDAGSDDHADTEDREVQGRQGLLELVVRFIGVRDGLLDALGAHDAHGAAPITRGKSTSVTTP